MPPELAERFRTYRLVQLGLTLRDIDESYAVDLDWLLAIDGVVAKHRKDIEGG